MTELSPAAQEIKDAAIDAYWLFHPAQAAAIIRAAADQIQFEGQLGMTAYGGHAQAQSQLLDIAAELENIPQQS
jgi:hypothetical protein